MRSIRTSVVMLASGALACAADETPAKKAPAPTEDAIAAAKREFDAVKSARTTPDLTTADLPKFSAPQLQVGGSALPTPPRRVAEKANAQKKSANWLVDAMAESDPKAAKGDPRGAREKALAGFEAKAADESSAQQKEKRPEKKPAVPVVNPLDRYMESWMTPQDLALLKPLLRPDNASPLSDVDPLKIPSLTDSARGQRGGREGSALAANDVAGKPKAVRENPYLAALGMASGPATAPAMLTPTPPLPTAPRAPAPAAVPVTPEPPAAQKTTVPSFMKPREDEKFNRQMKRF
jgi:hypothetical protein